MPRKVRKKYHYLYKTTNVINGNYYIGIHSTYKMKDGYLGSGTRLWNSIYKYGKENFIKEELEFFETREELLQREKEVVNEKMLQDSHCMNLIVGGGVGWLNANESGRKGGNSFAKRLKTDKKFAKEIAKTTKENFKNAHRDCKIKYDTFVGKKHTEKTKKKIGLKNSVHQTGEKNSQYGTCWIYKGRKCKKVKNDQLQRMLKCGWNKGRKMF